MKLSPFALTLFVLTLFSLFLFSACEKEPLFSADGIYIRLKNETDTQLTDLNYSFGFEEDTKFVRGLDTEDTSVYHRFDNADRCSGIFLNGTLASGGTVTEGRALCAVPDPMVPGRYSFVIRETTFTRTDGTTGTFIRTVIVED